MLGRTNQILLYDTDRIENDASNNSSIVACVFVVAITFLPSRCLAAIGGYRYRHTDQWEGYMNYGVGVGTGAMIYIPTLIKIGAGI
jgi:hypothetical protein